MFKSNITIIGAGVVGLAVSAYLSEYYLNIYLIERSNSFGFDSSSRNSEVIHASIYYPANSLKGKLCLKGNELLYQICKLNNIPHKNSGKLIITTNQHETDQLPALLEKALSNGAKGVRIINKDEILKIEPKVEAVSAIYCPTSGIVDSHKLMQYFENYAIKNGVSIVYNTLVTGINKSQSGYEITVQNKGDISDKFTFKSDIVINCAGLESGNIAALAGIDIDKENYRISYRKGIYCRVNHKLDRYPEMLIYPVPPEAGSVGIHTTPDCYGGMRLGPHFFWENKIDYSVDDTYHEYFYEESKKFLPFLEYNDISPDISGIMSSIQKPGEEMKDFVIREESDKDLPRLINLIGIESPGLTASPAIGEYVLEIVKNLNYNFL